MNAAAMVMGIQRDTKDLYLANQCKVQPTLVSAINRSVQTILIVLRLLKMDRILAREFTFKFVAE